MIRLVTIGLLCILNVSSFGQELSFQVTWLEDGQQIHLEAWASNMPPLLSHQGSFGFDGTAFEFSEWVDYQGSAPWVWSTSSGVEDGGAWSAYSVDLTPQIINEELPLFSCLLTISDPEIDSFLAQWGQGGTMLEFIGADFSEIDVEASGIQLTNPSLDPDQSDGEPGTQADSLYATWEVEWSDMGHRIRLLSITENPTTLMSFQGSLSFVADVVALTELENPSGVLPGVAMGAINAETGLTTFSWFAQNEEGVQVEQGDVLIELEIEALQDSSSFTIDLTGAPLPIEVISSSFLELGFESEPGSFVTPSQESTTGVFLDFEVIDGSYSNVTIEASMHSVIDISGIQGTLNFDPNALEVLSISSDLDGFSESNIFINSSTGTVSFVWFSSIPVEAGSNGLFQVEFAWAGEATQAALTFSDIPLELEFINSEFQIEEIAFESLNVVRDLSNSSALSLTGNYISASQIQFDLVANESMTLLSAQGSFGWNVDGSLQELTSPIFPSFSSNNFSMATNAVGWSWFSSNLSPAFIAPGDILLSGVVDLNAPVDSTFISFGNTPIPIEFANVVFQTLEISNLTALIINDGPIGNSCPADFDNNCLVGAGDLLYLLAEYTCSGTNCNADLNGDGSVNVADLLDLLTGYGQMSCCN